MKYAVLDFETTGSGMTDEVIQAGLVIVEDGKITKRFSSYINPTVEIPPFITQLTGITEDMVKDAPPLDEVLLHMIPLLDDAVLVAHHAAFDVSFLQRSLEQCGYLPFSGRVLDTLDLLRILFPSMPSLQLSMVCKEMNIHHDRPHQADSDAEVTALIWIRCLEKLEDLSLLTTQRISALFEDDSSDLSWFMQENRFRKELHISSDEQSGNYHRQFELNVGEWPEETSAREDDPDPALKGIAFEEFYKDLKARLQGGLKQYEDRSAQEQMIHEVYDSLEDDKHLLIEAGTGTGKSLGYLIPSLYYAIRREKKIIVSTHTINLQEQLRERDLPLLEHIFPVDFRASVLKGRSHYLCLRKFEHKINGSDFESPKEDVITAAQMIVWLSETMHGDEEEIHFGNKGSDFWHSVSSDADSCLNRSCPWFRRCFYHRARHEANIADVVITNHSLLFTDVKADHRILPSYDHLVVDEAHHFEEVAGKHMGMNVNYFSLVNPMLILLKDSRSGQIPHLRNELEQLDDDKSSEWMSIIDDVIPKIISAKEHWDKLTELLYELTTATASQDPGQGETGQMVYRLKTDVLPAEWDTLAGIENNLYIELSDALKKLDKIISEVKEHEDSDISQLGVDMNSTVRDLLGLRDDIRMFMKLSDPGYVYWLEANSYYKGKSLSLMAVPADVSGKLREHFFEPKHSVILTSATLSVDKSFQYAAEQLGLDTMTESGRVRTKLLASPFNYRKQALVCIPRDFPGVRGPGGETKFTDMLADSLRDVALQTRGRMLVLFTSYRMLKLVHGKLKEQLGSQGIQVLGQGIDSGNRSKLTRMFQDSSGAVLLGTSSFWEGVDIPGSALTCLVIVRLPFQPPNHPLVEAKSEMLQRQNKNPFMKLSVPQAVIRFKQGFGRLVRTGQDKGIVIIYDTRVLDTYYGKHFLYSLPGPRIEHMRLEQLVPRIRDWQETGE
ncbi:ATP-dependent DNA helicase DinG [Paenibacillus swuensis]|uniref:3'-5' exonuclease DinG n=1 Tax=Paenibacillus swuensis TaxID=1178515 RepID=A0A172TLU1_9BACL|nr:ATP-dependent DNA helicase DinG [Paenibacillus swuensis]ANE47936.1 ATP-dependent DNA helicase DinG [Paenibacillus swuensis]